MDAVKLTKISVGVIKTAWKRNTALRVDVACLRLKVSPATITIRA